MTRVNRENKFACVTTATRDLPRAFTRGGVRWAMVVRCVVPRVNADARWADAVAGAARKRDMTRCLAGDSLGVSFAAGCVRFARRRARACVVECRAIRNG